MLAKTLRLKFFSLKLLRSNVKTVALIRAAENEGENHKIGFEVPFTLRLAGHIEMYFPVFLFIISGFCLIFGWMLFLSESLFSLWKYFFLLRINCSVYIINSLLVANCMCSWAPYLFDCRSRLIKFVFHHFMRLTIKCGLHFLSLLYRNV